MPKDEHPGPRYHGDVWGALPEPFPKTVAELVYRSLLDAVPAGGEARPLMTAGFKAVAYRWWMTWQSHESYSAAVRSGGPAPGPEGEWAQEAALFSFFTGGLSVLESFSFALHAIGSHFAGTSEFSLENLHRVKPETVAPSYSRVWPGSGLSGTLTRLIASDRYKRWKSIRNALSHRAVPSRRYTLVTGSHTEETWLLDSTGVSGANHEIVDLTEAWWDWMSDTTRLLWCDLRTTLADWDVPEYDGG